MKINLSDKNILTDVRIIAVIKNEKIIGNFSKTEKRLIDNAIELEDFTGDEYQTLLIYDEQPKQRLLLVGLGNGQELKSFHCMEAGANALNAIKKLKINSISLEMNEKYLIPFLKGFLLANYKFDKYLSKTKGKNPKTIEKITIISKNKQELPPIIEEIQEDNGLVNYVKDLVNMPAEDLGPEDFVKEVKKIKKNSRHIKLKIFDKAKIKKIGMGGLYAVGKGNNKGTYMLILEYKYKAKNNNPYVFVGKGITFDTGGLNMKPSQFILNMHLDMAGAATVLGLFNKLTKDNIPGYFVGIISVAENSVGPDSYKPNDILKMYSGHTVEIANTDAEGRLILADALAYACKNYKPEFIIDIATLTGAAIITFGYEITAFISTDKKLSNKIMQASKRSNEMFWELPMKKFHIKATKGEKADITNASDTMPCGTIMGGAFLANFVDKEIPWMHIDIAASAWLNKTRIKFHQAGATGVPLLTLFEFIKDL